MILSLEIGNVSRGKKVSSAKRSGRLMQWEFGRWWWGIWVSPFGWEVIADGNGNILDISLEQK